jgi:formamidopyrimidine-DNA glycosylase
MPELPEVARTATSLNQKIKNSQLTEMVIHSGRYSRHGEPKGFEDLQADLPAKVEKVEFFGKLIVFTYTGKSGKQWFMWNTLGMSGGWRTEAAKHSHVELKTTHGSVFFTDARNFGTIRITDSIEETKRKIKSVGPNHLNDVISDELFKTRLMKRSQSTLAEALMDQGLIGGIGNYIKAEVLYRAKLSPNRRVEELTDEDFSNLNKYTKKIVESSFQSRGASIRTYVNMDGEDGDFVFEFKVYGRKTCEAGYEVVREVTLDGRTTHWVPQIQK